MQRLCVSIRIVTALALAGGLSVSPGCDEDSGGPCVEADACICTDDCVEDCSGAGCGFECKDGADCSFSCPGGDCSVKCTDATSCELECPGGNCSMQCSGTARCELLECDGGCPLMCGGAQECSNSCGLAEACPTTP